MATLNEMKENYIRERDRLQVIIDGGETNGRKRRREEERLNDIKNRLLPQLEKAMKEGLSKIPKPKRSKKQKRPLVGIGQYHF